MIQTKKI